VGNAEQRGEDGVPAALLHQPFPGIDKHNREVGCGGAGYPRRLLWGRTTDDRSPCSSRWVRAVLVWEGRSRFRAATAVRQRVGLLACGPGLAGRGDLDQVHAP
jgi:hypothetical protein